jgi:hypothetical protein
MTSKRETKPAMVYAAELLEYNLEKFMGNDCPRWYKLLYVLFLILPLLVNFAIPLLGMDFPVVTANVGVLHVETTITHIIVLMLILFEVIILLAKSKETTPATAPVVFLTVITLLATGVLNAEAYHLENVTNISVLLLVLVVGSTATNLKEPMSMPVGIILQKWGHNIYKSGTAMFLLGFIGSAFLDQVTMLFVIIGGLAVNYYHIKNLNKSMIGECLMFPVCLECSFIFPLLDL